MENESSKNRAPYSNSDIFTATVVSCDPATLNVRVSPDGENGLNVIQAVPVISTFSAAIGFGETMLPSVGTKVLCHSRGDATFIIGCTPYTEFHGDPKTAVLPNKAILGAGEPVFQSVHKNGYMSDTNKTSVINNGMPTDVVAGEKVFANEFGVTLGLFKLMATLKGSELAQIQCYFLDDLVRVISHNFQHYTALGETRIFHDGKGIHMEVGATHRPTESMGTNDSATTNIATLDPTKNETYNQFYKLNDDQLVMLERMKLFVGKLGDFINLMVIQPSDEIHALNGKALNTPDTGLLQIRAGTDGSLVVRSVNGIYLEKTNWIRVPQRIRTPEDPAGDDGVSITYPDKEAYDYDETYTYRDTAFLYYLQLRDYLAYINEEVGYANFNAHKGDFNVNSDNSKEQKINTITYVDPDTGASFKRTKSFIALMNNGGVSMGDAWGSGITMEGGNIYIQPAKDLVMQPNRNLVAKVGGNIAIAAKNEIDLSSTEGGMRIKTHEAQYLYSSNNGIILHADGAMSKDSFMTYGDMADSDSKMIEIVSGIVFKAPNSSINSYSQQIYSNAINDIVSKAPQIISRSSAVTRIISDNELDIAGINIAMTSKNETVSYSKGTNTLIGNTETVIAKKGQTYGLVSFMGGQIPVNGILDPGNIQDQAYLTAISKMYDVNANYDLTKILVVFSDDADFKTLTFQFPPSSLYELDDSDVIPQTLSQQTATLSDQNLLQNWVEENINNSYPYPGIDRENTLVTVKVNNISINDTDLINKAANLLHASTIETTSIFKQYKAM